ncbi:aspartate--ammonia ligase [Candidatus Woesearchaeota archaeon]|nr:aspartate--ammonia ligase [Candidatus Woesearchaeota archaeon]
MLDILPQDYKPKLDFFETQRAIKLVKDTFECKLAEKLHLLRVTAPRFLQVGKGLQDDLAGTQVPVGFQSKFSDKRIEMVHSLAKWKRYTLGRYGFKVGEGLYTDMDAVRKDEAVSPIHSIYVDQWDWEVVMTKEQRTIAFLKQKVKKIYEALLETEAVVAKEFPQLKPSLPEEIHFIHAEELEELYPDMSPAPREHEAAKQYGAFFLIGIGHPLKSGKPHDLRAADYDDWSTKTGDGRYGLNGDIIVWHPERKDALELSSMGIRVDKHAMLKQLKHLGQEDRQYLEFHKAIIEDRIPLSIGGGIGQSRICQLLLQKAHIGEVQSSAWPEQVEVVFAKQRIPLL